jgi:hypothetical protein
VLALGQHLPSKVGSWRASIWLPALCPGRCGTRPQETAGASGRDRNGRSLILSVDDKPVVLFTREKILEREGYAVVSARSGGEDRRQRVLKVYPPLFLPHLVCNLERGAGVSLAWRAGARGRADPRERKVGLFVKQDSQVLAR